MALTDTRIRNQKAQERPVRLSDAEGLHLEVRPSGKKLWRFRYRLHGKENLFALGEYPSRMPPAGEPPELASQRKAAGMLTLIEARQERDRCRELVKQGLNPAHQRQLRKLANVHASAETFQAIALEWIAAAGKEWSTSYRTVVERIINRDLIPALGKLPMRKIGAVHLLAALRKIEKRGAQTVAARARFVSSEIWRYAVATLRADSDLAAALKGAVRMPSHTSHPALAGAEIPRFLKALDKYAGRLETITALRLLLLLFPRPGELLNAPWSEFDLDSALWRIPAVRMKMREEHIVPLPTQAVALLCGLKALTGHRLHVFPHRDKRDGSMTDNALRQALHVMGYSCRLTPHGFRATAATALSELGYRSELIDKQLAHAERSKVRAAYLRSPFIEDRRKMLQAWADRLDAHAASNKVVTFTNRKVGAR